MTKRILFFALTLTAVSAFAEEKGKIYTAVAEYTKAGWDSRWSALEQLGIERAAEKRAYASCVQDGATDCVIVEGANITGCHYMTPSGSGSGCKATGYARGNR